MKGLEPDIQKLIAKHKAEIKKLKAMHQVSGLEILLIFSLPDINCKPL